jgi:calreticulin
MITVLLYCKEEEGEWEPPVVPNPAYKGPWAPQMIDNPDYKGAWVHPEIANPAFKEDANIARRCKDCTHIGFEIWQVRVCTPSIAVL